MAALPLAKVIKACWSKPRHSGFVPKLLIKPWFGLNFQIGLSILSGSVAFDLLGVPVGRRDGQRKRQLDTPIGC
jgi:hypothetical protein